MSTPRSPHPRRRAVRVVRWLAVLGVVGAAAIGGVSAASNGSATVVEPDVDADRMGETPRPASAGLGLDWEDDWFEDFEKLG